MRIRAPLIVTQLQSSPSANRCSCSVSLCRTVWGVGRLNPFFVDRSVALRFGGVGGCCFGSFFFLDVFLCFVLVLRSRVFVFDLFRGFTARIIFLDALHNRHRIAPVSLAISQANRRARRIQFFQVVIRLDQVRGG